MTYYSNSISRTGRENLKVSFDRLEEVFKRNLFVGISLIIEEGFIEMDMELYLIVPTVQAGEMGVELDPNSPVVFSFDSDDRTSDASGDGIHAAVMDIHDSLESHFVIDLNHGIVFLPRNLAG